METGSGYEALHLINELWAADSSWERESVFFMNIATGRMLTFQWKVSIPWIHIYVEGLRSMNTHLHGDHNYKNTHFSGRSQIHEYECQWKAINPWIHISGRSQICDYSESTNWTGKIKNKKKRHEVWCLGILEKLGKSVNMIKIHCINFSKN